MAAFASQFKQTFRALRHKNYRIFWVGQCISLIGTWLQHTAQIWLTYSITKSALLLGILGVCQYAPILFLSLFAGVIVDRFPKKKLLIIIQSLMMVQAVLFTILLYTNTIQYWHILLLSAFLGLLNTFDLPVRQSFLIEMTGKGDLVSAISLNGLIVNIARVAGPALAGLLFAIGDIKLGFLINSLTFMAVLLSLLFIKVLPVEIPHIRKSIAKEALDGVRYIMSYKKVLLTLISVIVVGTFAMNQTVLVPVLVHDKFLNSEHIYTTLLTLSGVGAIIGALLVSSKSNKSPQSLYVYGSAIMLSLSLVAVFFLSDIYTVSVAIAFSGFFNMIFLLSANSTIQMSIDDTYRGRVMSVYGIAFMGTTPIGNFLSGLLTEYYGSAFGYLICGIVTFSLIVTLYYIKQYSNFGKQK